MCCGCCDRTGTSSLILGKTSRRGDEGRLQSFTACLLGDEKRRKFSTRGALRSLFLHCLL